MPPLLGRYHSAPPSSETPAGAGIYSDADGSGTVSNPDRRLKHPPVSTRGSFVVTGDPYDGALPASDPDA